MKVFILLTYLSKSEAESEEAVLGMVTDLPIPEVIEDRLDDVGVMVENCEIGTPEGLRGVLGAETLLEIDCCRDLAAKGVGELPSYSLRLLVSSLF